MIRYILTLMTVLVGYYYLGSYQAIEHYKQQLITTKGIEFLEKQIANKPQDRFAYLQLAQDYIYQNRFQSAQQIYDYLLFSEGHKADLLAGKATALYYVNQQRMNQEIEQLLSLALQIEPQQITASMLLAADHFNQARYQAAIDLWQQLLDSQQPDLDRVTLINAIHTSQMLLNRYYQPSE